MRATWSPSRCGGRIQTLSSWSSPRSSFSYDPGIGEDDRETGAAEENYYEYRDADWYERARSAEDYVITEPHPNAYGRGQVITFLAPVKNAESRFAGCIGIDIRLEDLNESIVKYWIPPHISVLLTDPEGNVLAGSDVDYAQWPFGTIYDSEKYGSLSEAAEDILKSGQGFFQVGKDDNAVCAASAPVDSAGWKLLLEMPVSAINQSTNAIRENIDENLEMTSYSIRLGLVKILRNILILTELILLAIIFMSENLSRRITSPLIQLERDVTEISAGNFQQRSGVTSNDEIGSLAASFNNMADSLERYIADIREMTAKEERIAAELTLAAQIQDGMLPKDTGRFSAGRGFELGAFMKPAKEVAGDFYDYFMIDDEHLALVIADVSGKGVPAALFMARAMTSIRMRASAGGTPAQILRDVNVQMCERNDEQLFVTIWLAVIDLETGAGLASNAGHEHPVLRRAGGSYELVIYKHAPMIGAFRKARFEEHAFELHPGDSLLVYTDGVPEANSGDARDQFGPDRLIQALNRAPDADPDQTIRNVHEAIIEFSAGAEQFDDITMLCFRYRGPREQGESGSEHDTVYDG